MITVRSTMLKPAQLEPQWFVIDAEGMVVGRLASQIATVLMGKHRPDYTPHVLCGDYVIVVNADQVRFTGDGMVHDKHQYATTKLARKKYRWYTGWPGGEREVTALKLWERKPEEILRRAVKRMLPKTALGRHMLDRLKLYSGPNHPHQAQQPQPWPDYLQPR